MAFHLFKKNTNVWPIFEPLVTDMHCHLVPKVDDGSKCLEESVDCLNTMYQLGYRRVVITPHFQYPRFNNDEEDILSRFADLKFRAAEAGVMLELAGVAGEYRIDSGFQGRLDNPRFLKISDRYVLVEFSLHHQMMGVDEMIFDMQMKGYEVILAHPERYPYLNIQGARVAHLKDQGVYFQINALSLGGFYGEEARRKAFDMVERGWVEFVGTDTHNTMYAQALSDLTRDRRVVKLFEKYEFLNKTL